MLEGLPGSKTIGNLPTVQDFYGATTFSQITLLYDHP